MRMALVLFAVATPASATDLPCGPVEPGVISLDGLTDDWNDVQGVEVGNGDSNLSFTVKCNLAPRALYLLVDVRDDYFARTRQTRPGEDHLELTLGRRKLIVYPGDAAQLRDRATWGRKPAKMVHTFGALQAHGWAVELELPLGEAGIRPGTPRLAFSARVADCDSKVRLKTDRVAELSGAIAFAEAESALDTFLRQQRLTRNAIWFDKMMATGSGQTARVLLAGRYLVLVSDGYIYQELPFRDRSDLREARIVDLAGDGPDALVLRYRERADSAPRELLPAYAPDAAAKL